MKSAAVVDSSVWIEIFGNLKKSQQCQNEIKKYKRILIPTIVIFEIQRKMTQLVGTEDALSASSFLSKYEISNLTREIAIDAADLSIEHHLGSADSIVLAHAQHLNAVLITLDNDFSGLTDVIVIR